ncbi:hypothetical protein, partial [Solidesulfovibrio alcoholivorans]|uniref:hypothetical protein n=1 Tax=Solidesulfovibrio alcoholivorans TaxID=81406 RepID=UPI001B7FF8F5
KKKPMGAHHPLIGSPAWGFFPSRTPVFCIFQAFTTQFLIEGGKCAKIDFWGVLARGSFQGCLHQGCHKMILY